MTITQAQHTRTRTIALGVAGVLVASLGWLTWTDYRALEDARKETETVRAAIVKTQADIRTVPQLEEDVLVVRETVKRHVAILPDEKDINGFVDRLSSFATDAGVKIVKLDDQEARARNNRPGKKATAAFDRISYKLSLSASTDSVLRFLDLFENHERFVKIPVFKISRAQENGNAADAVAATPNDVDLEIETYVYNPTVRAKEPVTVPDEAKKLEGLAKRGLLAKVMSESVVPAAWRHDPSMMRRDPFVDPRIASARENERGEAARIAEEAELEQLVGTLNDAAGAVKKEVSERNAVKRAPLKADADRLLTQVGAKIKEIQGRNGFAVDAVRARFEKDVLVPFDALVRSRGQVLVTVDRAHVENMLARVKEAVADGRHEEAVNFAEQAGALRTGSDPNLAPIFEEIADEARLARAWVEFAGIEIECKGTIVPQDAPERSVAILNGVPVAAGEGVPGRPDITVRSISRVSVTFLYKGVAIERPVKGLSPKGTEPKAQPGRPGAPKKKN